jgi:hypothetical protein
MIMRKFILAGLFSFAMLAPSWSQNGVNLTMITVSSQAASTPVNVAGALIKTFGLVATVSPGASLTYNVEVTADVNPSAGGNWNPHDVIRGMTASANGNIAYPITGIRLNVTTWVSGSVTLGIAR